MKLNEFMSLLDERRTSLNNNNLPIDIIMTVAECQSLRNDYNRLITENARLDELLHYKKAMHDIRRAFSELLISELSTWANATPELITTNIVSMIDALRLNGEIRFKVEE